MTSAAFAQSPEYAEALRLCRATLSWHSGRLLLRRRFAGVPLTLASRVRDIDADWIHGLPRGPVLLNPDAAMPELSQIGAVQVLTPATTVTWDLRPDIAALRTGMHQKWRNRLRRAEAGRLKVIETAMPADPAHWLLQADAKQEKQRAYRNWPARVTCAYAHLHPGKTHLFSVEENGDPIAAMLFMRHGKMATYHIGITSEKGRSIDAHRLVLWHAAQRLKARGVSHLDLGLIDTLDAPGLARFKLGTGAKARELGGTWLWWPPLARLGRARFGGRQIPTGQAN